MSRMIEDTAVLSRIDDIRPANPKKDNYTHGIDVGLAMAKVAIKDAPTIEERKTGKWQITDAYPHNVYCSECHKRFAQTHWKVWEDGTLPRDFCPNCGARMM